jgi:hypothetical protein
MRILTAAAIPVLLVASACTATALDCARVKALNGEGRRPADIARELGITTPDVQSCLADEAETPTTRSQPAGSEMPPTLPAADSPIPRPPNQ